MKRIAVILASIAAIIVLGFLMRPEPPTVNVIEVRSGQMLDFVDDQATTRLSHIYRITMPLDGRIEAITLMEGSAVSENEAVASLDTSDLETEVARAEARIQELDAELAVNGNNKLENGALDEIAKTLQSMARVIEAAKMQTKSSEAVFGLAAQQYKRQQQLRERSATSEREIEKAEVAQVTSQVERDKDVLNLRALEAFNAGMQLWPTQIANWIDRKKLQREVLVAQKAEAEARLIQARRDLGRADLKSPVTGVVLKRHVSNERVLKAGSPLLEIGNPSDLEVEADILSIDAVSIRQGQEVQIYSPNLPDFEMTGRVQRVYPQGFTKLSSLGVEQQRVKVVIAFAEGELGGLLESNQTLGSGYRLRVRIITANSPDAVQVPRSSVFQAPDGSWQLLAVKNGVIETTTVELGLINDEQVEIVSGVEPGDQVVAVPDNSMKTGDPIVPIVIAPRKTPATPLN